jgi:ligand-binding sensor domain-containing protein
MNKQHIFFCILAVFFVSAVFAEDYQIKHVDHPLIKDRRIYAVASEKDKTAWATRSRIVYFSREGTKVFDSNNSPLRESASISDVAICEGKLWVTQIGSANGHGIFHYDNHGWSTFKEPEQEGILNNRILKIHVDEDNVIWFGHEFYGVTRMVENIPMIFKAHKMLHLFKNRLLSLHMQLTHLWLGSTNGIVRFRSEIKSKNNLNIDTWEYPEFPARAAYCLTTDSKNRLIAGTGSGLAVFENKKWKLFKKDSGIAALPITHIEAIGNDLWLGSPAGLQKWSYTTADKTTLISDKLPGRKVTALCCNDNKTRLFVGCDEGGAIIELKDCPE